MIQIRSNIFETNSSSTHSLTICTEEEYDAWKCNDDVLLNEGWYLRDKQFITTEEARKFMHSQGSYYDPEIWGPEDDWFADYGFYSVSKWDEKCSWFEESYKEHYTSPSGDKLIAFGYYGHD